MAFLRPKHWQPDLNLTPTDEKYRDRCNEIMPAVDMYPSSQLTDEENWKRKYQELMDSFQPSPSLTEQRLASWGEDTPLILSHPPIKNMFENVSPSPVSNPSKPKLVPQRFTFSDKEINMSLEKADTYCLWMLVKWPEASIYIDKDPEDSAALRLMLSKFLEAKKEKERVEREEKELRIWDAKEEESKNEEQQAAPRRNSR